MCEFTGPEMYVKPSKDLCKEKDITSRREKKKILKLWQLFAKILNFIC